MNIDTGGTADPERAGSWAEHARRVRLFSVQATARTQASHVGSALSVTDILVALYFGAMRRSSDGAYIDRCILSKGHAAVALYATLSEAGLISRDSLDDFYEDGSRIGGHPEAQAVLGIPAGTGSLGHGLSIGAGLALGSNIMNADVHTFVVMSDGECDEGAVWEAALFAAHHKLANLTAIVDRNGLQGLGNTEKVLALEPLASKWRAFNWNVIEADGHDHIALARAFAQAREDTSGPTLVLAKTVKGHGVSYMENDNLWHYRSARDDELAIALDELRNQ